MYFTVPLSWWLFDIMQRIQILSFQVKSTMASNGSRPSNNSEAISWQREYEDTIYVFPDVSA